MCDSLKTLLWSIVYLILIMPRLVIRTTSLMFFYGNQFSVEQDQILSPPDASARDVHLLNFKGYHILLITCNN